MKTAAQRWNISEHLHGVLTRMRHLDCPHCARSFTLPGLQRHRCPKLPLHEVGTRLTHETLTEDQIRQAIDFAIPF